MVIVAHEVIATAASMTRGIRRYLICCSFQRFTDAFATVGVPGEPTSCETDAITQINSEQQAMKTGFRRLRRISLTTPKARHTLAIELTARHFEPKKLKAPHGSPFKMLVLGYWL